MTFSMLACTRSVTDRSTSNPLPEIPRASSMALVNRIGEGTARKPLPPDQGAKGEGNGADVVDGGGKWSTVGESGGREGRGGAMFSGTFKPKLDDKGRLFLPAKFRERMGDGLVITRGQERSIDVRTSADFEGFSTKLQNAPQTDARLRAYTRMLFALAS